MESRVEARRARPRPAPAAEERGQSPALPLRRGRLSACSRHGRRAERPHFRIRGAGARTDRGAAPGRASGDWLRAAANGDATSSRGPITGRGWASPQAPSGRRRSVGVSQPGALSTCPAAAAALRRPVGPHALPGAALGRRLWSLPLRAARPERSSSAACRRR